MEKIDTNDLKYDILDALRDLKTLASNNGYKDEVKTMIEKLRKCKLVEEK